MFLFKRKNKDKDAKEVQALDIEKNKPCVYVLLNTDSAFLARGEPEGEPGAANLQLRLTAGNTNDVVDAEIVQAVPSDKSLHVVIGRVILRRGNLIVLDPVREAGSEVRQNFRMPMDFDSFAYPPDGGRASFRAIDLSCGGIAFSSSYPFEVGQRYEVVIPITDEGPLILVCQVLRTAPYNGTNMYGAKFIDLLNDEETMVREAVFNVQLQSMQTRSKKK